MKVLLLTKYSRRGPSSRVRFHQYLPWLEERGVAVEAEPLWDDRATAMACAGEAVPLHSICWRYLRRIRALLAARHFDVVWLEGELWPYLPALGERLLGWRGAPCLVDYDDAAFAKYGAHPRRLVRALLGGKIAEVMRRAAVVVAGNAFLARHARRAGARRVEVVPSVVDLARYPSRLDSNGKKGGRFRIGWIGSAATTAYLDLVAGPLGRAHAAGCEVALVGASRNPFAFPARVIPWSEAGETEELRRFDVGIMPLPDHPMVPGKCGYKLIQSMACGTPVIASPRGIGPELVRHGENGFLAVDDGEWDRSIARLRGDPELCARMGRAGRERVAAAYQLAVTAPEILRLLGSAAAEGSR